jgi:hypothetical protein
MPGHVDPIKTLTAGSPHADRRVEATKAIAANQGAERKSVGSPGKDRK